MEVWIANPFDNLPPEGCRPQRYWLMARAFARAGHRVTLWTSDFSHARKAPRKLAPGAAWDGDGFRLVMVPTPQYPRNICIRRFLSHRTFARNLLTLAELEPRKPDLTIASMPPLSSAAALSRFCHSCGSAFVADIMDAWPENFERIVPRWMLAPLRSQAKRIYRSADGISAVASRYIDLARSYGATCPMHLAYHGIEIPPETPKACNARRQPPFRLVYVGSMGTSYDLETAIDAVRGLQDVALDIAGAGPKEHALRERAAGCGQIRFHGYLDAAAMRTMLADADAGLVPMFDDSCVGVPYKLADYAAAHLPVINTLHGETERLLDEYEAGTTCDAHSIAAMRDAITRLRAEDASALRAGAAALARLFDEKEVYPAYVAWAVSLGIQRTGTRSRFK